MLPSVAPEHTRSAIVDGKRIYLVKVARAQKVLIWLVLAMLVCNGGGLVLLQAASGSLTRAQTGYLFMAFGLLQLAIVLVGIAQTVRLAVASGSHLAVAAIIAIAMFVPLLGAIVLLLTNQRATGILQTHRVRVGFMGVTAEEMRKLILGACPACGYDIRGLPDSICPECGTALAKSPTPEPSDSLLSAGRGPE